MIIGTSKTRSKHKHRTTLRIPILYDATFDYWMQSLNMFDQHALQCVSRKWQINSTRSMGTELFYGSLHVNCATLASPELFDEPALLRCLKLAGSYLHHLHLVGLSKLVLPRRSACALHLKEHGSKIVEVQILHCEHVNAHDQIGWLKSLPNLKKLNLAGCIITKKELKSLQQKLPDVELDLIECESPDCSSSGVFGGDTMCHCDLDTTANGWGDEHLQNGWSNTKKLCSNCMGTNLCSRCCTYFCDANVDSLECQSCAKLLCWDCVQETEARIQNGLSLKKNDWGCDDEHGECDCNDDYNHSTYFQESICSSCAIKCPNCDANLCTSESYYWDEKETPCNELKTCQYCATVVCNNCRVKDNNGCSDDLKNIGCCDISQTYGCDCAECSSNLANNVCESFTCSSCTDQMFKCEECKETRCGDCIKNSDMDILPKECAGCNRKLCGEKYSCSFEECNVCEKNYCLECRNKQEWEERRDEGKYDAKSCCKDCMKK